jgi:hypothetical protein
MTKKHSQTSPPKFPAQEIKGLQEKEAQAKEETSRKDRLPPVFSYNAVVHRGEKYISFPQDTYIPLEIIENIIKETKAKPLEPKNIEVGIILMIPNTFKGKKRGIILKGIARKDRVKHESRKKN